IFYFLQPGGAFIDTADPASAQATIVAILGNAGLGQVTSVVIPIGLLFFAFGAYALRANIGAGGNGNVLAGIGALFLYSGIVGWMIASGAGLAIAGTSLPAAQAVPVYGSLYGATVGIGTVSGILAGIGFLGLALAVSTRDDNNKMFALVAAAVAVVSIVVTILGALDDTQLQTMGNITGICYVIHMVWLILVGRNLSQQG
ncbi:uncharacterized protein METZ01_LOCUS290817, partial [marine metagenome]